MVSRYWCWQQGLTPNDGEEHRHLSAEDAAEEYALEVDRGDGYGTLDVEVNVAPVVGDDDGEVVYDRSETERHRFTLPDVQSPCHALHEDHLWARDHKRVGGLVENPGVMGSPHTGITITEECRLCGARRETTTRGRDADRVRYLANGDADGGYLADDLLEALDTLGRFIRDTQVEQGSIEPVDLLPGDWSAIDVTLAEHGYPRLADLPGDLQDKVEAVVLSGYAEGADAVAAYGGEE
jgi:hypothetical protein